MNSHLFEVTNKIDKEVEKLTNLEEYLDVRDKKEAIISLGLFGILSLLSFLAITLIWIKSNWVDGVITGVFLFVFANLAFSIGSASRVVIVHQQLDEWIATVKVFLVNTKTELGEEDANL